MSSKNDSSSASNIGNTAGQIGEAVALDYLLSKKYTLIKRNFTSRNGELDLIMQAPDQETLVFVEVKAYKPNSLLNPILAITPQKIKKLLQTVRYYQLCTDSADTPSRFDVIIVEANAVKEHLISAITLG